MDEDDNKAYLRNHNILEMVDTLVLELRDHQPIDPLHFMISWFQRKVEQTPPLATVKGISAVSHSTTHKVDDEDSLAADLDRLASDKHLANVQESHTGQSSRKASTLLDTSRSRSPISSNNSSRGRHQSTQEPFQSEKNVVPPIDPLNIQSEPDCRDVGTQYTPHRSDLRRTSATTSETSNNRPETRTSILSLATAEPCTPVGVRFMALFTPTPSSGSLLSHRSVDPAGGSIDLSESAHSPVIYNKVQKEDKEQQTTEEIPNVPQPPEMLEGEVEEALFRVHSHIDRVRENSRIDSMLNLPHLSNHQPQEDNVHLHVESPRIHHHREVEHHINIDIVDPTDHNHSNETHHDKEVVEHSTSSQELKAPYQIELTQPSLDLSPGDHNTTQHKPKVLVLFYSLFGHVYQLAEAIAEGVRQVPEVDVIIKRIPELMGGEMLRAVGADRAQMAFTHLEIAHPNEIPSYDGLVVGFPTRFGTIPYQVQTFLEQIEHVCPFNSLFGKVGGAFTCSGTQHGGQESTLLVFLRALMEQGMTIVGIPPTIPELHSIESVDGCSYYGASTISAPHGVRFASDNELKCAVFQGRHLATIVYKLFHDTPP